MNSSIENVLNQYSQVDIGSPDKLIAQDKYLTNVFTAYINSGEATPDTLNRISRFLKARIEQIEACPDTKVKERETNKLDNLAAKVTGVITSSSKKTVSDQPKQPQTPLTKESIAEQAGGSTTTTKEEVNLKEVLWRNVASMSNVKEKARLEQVDIERQAIVTQDPVQQIVKALKLIVSGKLTTPAELDDLLKNVNIPAKNDEERLIKENQINREINSVYSVRGDIASSHRVLYFLCQNYSSLNDFTKNLMNKFILNNLVNGMRFNPGTAYHFPEEYMNLPENKYLEIILSDANSALLQSFPDIKKDEISRQLELIDNMIQGDREFIDIYLQRIKDYKSVISKYLKEPTFIKALFFLASDKYRFNKTNVISILFADNKLSDPDLILSIAKFERNVFRVTHPDLLNNEDFILKAIDLDIDIILFVHADQQANPTVMLAAVKKNGLSLSYASEACKDNREIVMAAVQNYEAALQYASERLKKDSEIVFAAIKKDGFAILHADPMYLKNKDAVLKALKQVAHNIGQFMMTYEGMAPALKDDPEIAALHKETRKRYNLDSPE